MMDFGERRYWEEPKQLIIFCGDEISMFGNFYFQNF